MIHHVYVESSVVLIVDCFIETSNFPHTHLKKTFSVLLVDREVHSSFSLALGIQTNTLRITYAGS